MADEYTDVVLCKIDVDDGSLGHICQKHGVSAMPTLVVLVDGVQKGKMEGVNIGTLKKWCAKQI